jgi:hypothetical protein
MPCANHGRMLGYHILINCLTNPDHPSFPNSTLILECYHQFGLRTQSILQVVEIQKFECSVPENELFEMSKLVMFLGNRCIAPVSWFELTFSSTIAMSSRCAGKVPLVWFWEMSICVVFDPCGRTQTVHTPAYRVETNLHA